MNVPAGIRAALIVAAALGAIAVLRFKPWVGRAAEQSRAHPRETLKVGFLPVT